MNLTDDYFYDELFVQSQLDVDNLPLAPELAESLKRILKATRLIVKGLATKDQGLLEANMRVVSKEGSLFKEVGGMAREIHTHLRALSEAIDPKLQKLASTDVPEASDRLAYVIQMTEDAATKTLGIVEKKLEDNADISMKLTELESLGESLLAGTLSPADYHEKSAPLLVWLKEANQNDQNELMDIMMAQDFQDLSGQIIKKVITLVKELELQLVNLIVKFGVQVEEEPEEKAEEVLLNGPQIDKTKENVVSDQDDVDDILKQLGF